MTSCEIALTAYTRSATLTHFAEVAAGFGLDPRSLVRAAGLPVRCLDDPDLKVPAEAVGRLLELAAARSGEPAFALRMVESRRLSNLGPLGLLLRDEPTLRGLLEVLVRHIHVHNEALAMRVEPSGSLVLIREEVVTARAQPMRQATELALGMTFRVLGIIMGAGWRPRLVCFSHGAPPDLTLHRRVFGPAIEFGHEFNAIVCNAADLDVPNPAADPVMARYTQRLLELDAGGQARLSDRVRQLVVLLLPRGHCRVEAVAQHLGVDRRTVARRLAAEGTTFSGLVEGVRRDLMARYLNGNRPLAEVSALLGFAAPCVLSRWHRQRFGVTARSRISPATRVGDRVDAD